jgi:hypothetical protein
LSNEFISPTLTSGLNVYIRLHNLAPNGNQLWNTSTPAFETATSADVTTYDIAATETGGMGIYVGNFPTAITAPGKYNYDMMHRAGGSPATSDTVLYSGVVTWGGTASLVPNTALGQATCVDGSGNPLSGVVVYFQFVSFGEPGIIEDTALLSATSVGTGANNLSIQLIQGATYNAYRGTSTRAISTFTVPIGATSFSLPEIVGSP